MSESSEAPSRGEVLVYRAPDGQAQVDVRLERDTVWLSLSQIAELFGRDKSVISRHLRNVFESGELDRSATVAKNATVQIETGRQVRREIEFFNLDAILSVGYRVNSKRGTQFRIWATRTLREHLVRGYTLDRQRFARNAAELEAALSLVRKAAAGEALTTDMGRGLVDVIARYTQTFLLLQRYDEGLLAEPSGQPGGEPPSVTEARSAIAMLRRSRSRIRRNWRTLDRPDSRRARNHPSFRTPRNSAACVGPSTPDTRGTLTRRSQTPGCTDCPRQGVVPRSRSRTAQ